MKVIYKADDGTEFDDEAECKSHEARKGLVKTWYALSLEKKKCRPVKCAAKPSATPNGCVKNRTIPLPTAGSTTAATCSTSWQRGSDMPSPEELKHIADAHDAMLLRQARALDEAYAGTMPAEQYNADLLALVQAVRNTLKDRIILTHKGEELKAALEQFEPWLDAEETPQQMGWVDSKGRP